MLVLSAALVVAAAVWASREIVRELRAAREDTSRARALTILALFAPALGAADADPRSLLVWQPIARTARAIFPEEFAALDRAFGSTFPFSADRVQAAHAQWTADWLAWERTHDAEYKQKAAAAEHALAPSGDAAAVRAQIDAIEREKLDRYQRRYEEYIRVARALQAVQF